MAADDKSKEALQEEVWGAISAFEQILEAMPNDRASLEALAFAYEQIGDEVKGKEYLLRLGGVLIDENDAGAARELVSKIEGHADDAEVKAFIDRVEGLAPAAQTASFGDVSAQADGPSVPVQDASKIVSKGMNIDEELSLAWNLSEAEQITQEEYASIVQDLTEMSAGNMSSTVSALHILEARGFKNLERIIGFVAEDGGAPIVSISNFELKAEAVSLLPHDFMVQRGAVVFEVIGKDLLVVVMNPYSKQLRSDIEALAGRKCHYYTALPSEFDRILENVADIVAQAAMDEG